MNARHFSIDKTFAGILGIILFFGALIFLSASLTLLGESSQLIKIITMQLLFGLGGGIVGAYVVSRIPMSWVKKYALPLAITGIVLTALVFVIGTGVKGAVRWINLGPISFQPAEILKYTLIVYYAAWLSFAYKKQDSFWYTFAPLAAIIAVAGAVLLPQPDTDNFLVIAVTCTIMYFVAGGKWKHFIIMLLGGALLGGALIMTRPYIKARVVTFLNPSMDEKGASWQINQSLIAVGSGGLMGRGFGQSLQKHKYLPEPLSDSIYAVAAEEFGFLGSVFLLLLYVALGLRGYVIAMKTNDVFSRYVVVGVVTIVVFQSFLNIASIIGLFPLSGLPLIFVSHGGTSLLFSLLAMGLVLNVSRYQKTVTLPVIKKI
jgi:cell division protein FtsW